ncbi:ATP-dependent DNA helicase Q-like 4A isoform X1 [Cucumis melo var. makuwa]|uniref:ATP-dependent DNA helicase Q-like 4A isoform X1 n=1 Tax=Cucumis melo var. makuwa TaxID=1194695 RepID=A0A5A7T665_CUCMM|nr:ATP-dependent DNA helicase Q-like 4A isoform X1 [Cucumis melo var. makuwa]
MDGSVSFATNQKNICSSFLEDEDDEIIENIDVDLIVEQYQSQSACILQPSVSKLPPITPIIEKDNVARQGNLIIEMSSIHCYQLMLQIELCLEASSHLQELKDRIVSISNDLLDNVNNLSPVQIDKLRQERTDAKLNTSYVHQDLEPRRIEPWNSMCSSYVDERFGMSSGPVEREPYIPKVIDVNYTEAPCFDMSWCNIGDISTCVSYSRSDHAFNTGKFNL